MTTHRAVPSEIDPESLADLIGDCDRLPATLLAPVRTTELRRLPRQRRVIEIPETTRSLLARYGDYGV